jgi:hypothetical protein
MFTPSSRLTSTGTRLELVRSRRGAYALQAQGELVAAERANTAELRPSLAPGKRGQPRSRADQLDSPRSTLGAVDGLFADPPTAEKHLRRDCELAPCAQRAGRVCPAPTAVSLPAVRRHLIGRQTSASVGLVPAYPMTVEELEAGEVGAAGGALVERVQRILLRLSE